MVGMDGIAILSWSIHVIRRNSLHWVGQWAEKVHLIVMMSLVLQIMKLFDAMLTNSAILIQRKHIVVGRLTVVATICGAATMLMIHEATRIMCIALYRRWLVKVLAIRATVPIHHWLVLLLRMMLAIVTPFLWCITHR